jgi:HTH-type transcriptional regulator/antitoxin HipB
MQHINSSIQIGKILASRRKVLGISQAVLATKLRISQGRVSELETQPGALTVDRLLVVLNLLGLELAVNELAPKAKQMKLSKLLKPLEW